MISPIFAGDTDILPVATDRRAQRSLPKTEDIKKESELGPHLFPGDVQGRNLVHDINPAGLTGLATTRRLVQVGQLSLMPASICYECINESLGVFVRLYLFCCRQKRKALRRTAHPGRVVCIQPTPPSYCSNSTALCGPGWHIYFYFLYFNKNRSDPR